MYSVVLLDADGTLFDYDQAESYALEHAFGHFGLEYDPDRHLPDYRAFNSSLWLDLELGKIASTVLRTERFRLLFERHGIDADVQGFSATYLRHLGEARHLVEGAEETCEYLASRCRLAIVTNGIKDVQMSRIKSSPLAKHIEHIIVSEDAGYQKPDPRIFEHTLRLLDHSAKSSVLMVGDSLTSDIKGGIAFGIDTCWYNPNGAEMRADIAPRFVIRRLTDLRDLV